MHGAAIQPQRITTDHRTRLDEELVRSAQGGERRAFDELVRRYEDRVFRLSCRILRHEDDAADARQDAFLSAYHGLKKFRADSTFSTWLYRIATNASLMKYRGRRDHHISLDQPQGRNDETQPLQLPDRTAQPPEDLLTAETGEVMEKVIQRLPEALRKVFVLRGIEELSNAEAGEILNLSVAAVKSRLHRARTALRKGLHHYVSDRMTKKDVVHEWSRETNGRVAMG